MTFRDEIHTGGLRAKSTADLHRTQTETQWRELWNAVLRWPDSRRAFWTARREARYGE